MTRARLITTTAAILLPATFAFAQSTDTEDATTGGDGNAAMQTEMDPSSGVDTQAEGRSNSVADALDNTLDSAAETADEAMDTTGNVIEEAADTAGTAIDEAAENTEEALTGETETAAAQTPGTSGMTVGELVGSNVVDASGREIGELDSLVEGDEGAFGVIGVGGIFGIGERSVAVPVSEMTVGPDGTVRLQSHTESDLEAMPEADMAGRQEMPASATAPELG